eukprot:CAMPEP_0203981052 /NCGR_PEP_ID=MMETSP0360-20130528/1952_1 /ASSEMBLY_ACC=CAM_ASM_000342 /TAXON_ID=268821 /ORGANISM="Scrippsiella Hangoei, Strain SHTV-5" /LENGTH=45 /DNA_ID= /DNA_START= /DNA_END= /DNA_ORIENTATION=
MNTSGADPGALLATAFRTETAVWSPTGLWFTCNSRSSSTVWSSDS